MVHNDDNETPKTMMLLRRLSGALLMLQCVTTIIMTVSHDHDIPLPAWELRKRLPARSGGRRGALGLGFVSLDDCNDCNVMMQWGRKCLHRVVGTRTRSTTNTSTSRVSSSTCSNYIIRNSIVVKDEESDCFFNQSQEQEDLLEEEEQCHPFAFYANIKQIGRSFHQNNIFYDAAADTTTTTTTTTPTSASSSTIHVNIPSLFTKAVQNAILSCHQSSPSVMYTSILQRKRQNQQHSHSTTTSTTSIPRTKSRSVEDEEEEMIQEPSQHLLSGIVKPLIPTSIWNSLTGYEFYYPSTLANLVTMGIKMTNTLAFNNDDEETEKEESECFVDWKPADSKTKSFFEHYNTNDHQNTNTYTNTDESTIRHALLQQGEIFVWTGKFITNRNNNNKKQYKQNDDGYGSNLPLVRTISVIPLSPKAFAELLMDSNQVQSYNKMSLGRKDVVVFQKGVDSLADGSETSAGGGRGSGNKKFFALDGEAKIVRNVTKPPMSKKLMEFVTLMYARRLNSNDKIKPGLLGGGAVSDIQNSNDNCGSYNPPSYIVVTRAVSGGRWCNSDKSDKVNVSTRGGGSGDEEKEEMTRSEILLGVNLLRNIPGEPNKTEVTAVTHVYSPSVPTMLASAVGVKGAIDFVKDIRALYK